MCDSILNGEGTAVCSSELDLAVQVTGTGHVANPLQKLAIRIDGKGNANYANTNEEINTAEKEIPSTIFKWPEDIKASQGKKQLVLEIPTTQGKKITLPVCENLQTCGSHPALYFLGNRLYSVAPLIHFGSYTDDDEKYFTQYYGAARAGYIYIFVGNTLWRELLVSRDQEGKNTFEDTDLANFRDNNHHYKDSKRETAGVKLKDIWVPGSFQNNTTPQVRIAFSDMQWSGSRINYLQSNQSQREQRTILLKETENKLIEQIFSTKDKFIPKITNYTTPLVSFTLLPPTRARNEAVEFLIDHPSKYLVTPDYITFYQQKTQADIDSFLTTSDQKRQLNLKPSRSSAFDASAWQYNQLKNKQPYIEPQQGIQPPVTQRTIDEENIYNNLQEVWTDQTPFTDSLQELRTKGILGILIEDPNYQVTCAKERIKLLASAFMTATQQAQTDPNFRIASLIEKQRKIAEEFEKGITKQMGDEGRRQYDRTVAGPIRRELHRRVNSYKQVLTNFLGADHYFQHFMADFFSNYDNPVDLVGHFSHITEVLNLMSLSMASYDPLLPVEAENDTTIFSAKGPYQVVLDITTNPRNPLHQMLYPNVEFATLHAPYKPTAQSENQGDGLFNEGLWYTISNNDSLLNQQPTTLSGAALSMIAEQADVKLLTEGQFPNFKVMNAAIYSLVAALADARKRAQENILTQQIDYQQARRELQIAEQQLNTYKRDQQRVATSRDLKLRDLQRYQTRIATAQQTLQDIEQAFHNKLEQLGAVRARIPTKELAMLRITGGQSFRNLQIQLQTTITIKGTNTQRYYVLGNIDHVPRPRANLKRNFSLFDQNVLFDSKTRGSRSDIYLIVMPENDPYVVLRRQQLTEQIPQLEAQINQSRRAVNHIEGQLLTLDNKQALTTEHVNRAETTVGTGQNLERQAGTLFRQSEKTINSRLNAIAERIERTGVVPPVLLGLELINITIVIKSFYDTRRIRGSFRAGFGLGVALGDTTMATIAVLETLQNQHQLFAKKTVVARGLKALGNKSDILIRMGLQKAVVRTIPLGILAVLNTGLSAWDAYTAFRHGDGAVYGHIVLALAGAASIMSILAGAGASVWFGPAGWIVASFLLVVAGIALLWKFSDTELEQWFKQGPFGKETNYPALKQPDEALAVLLNMVFQPNIAIEANPFQELAKERLCEQSVANLTPEQYDILLNVSQANTCIMLDTELMGFADTNTIIRYACRLYRYQETTQNFVTPTYQRTYTAITHEVLHIEITPNGAIIFTHTPKANSYQQGYLWLAANQVVTEFTKPENNTGGETHQFYHFPAPPFTEKVQYNPLKDDQLTLAMPNTNRGNIGVDGSGDLTGWAQKLAQPFWKKLLIDGNNII